MPEEWWKKQAGKQQFNLEFDDNGNVVAKTDPKQAALEGSAPNENWADKIGNFFIDNFGKENDKTEEVTPDKTEEATPVEEPKDEKENLFNF